MFTRTFLRSLKSEDRNAKLSLEHTCITTPNTYLYDGEYSFLVQILIALSFQSRVCLKDAGSTEFYLKFRNISLKTVGEGAAKLHIGTSRVSRRTECISFLGQKQFTSFSCLSEGCCRDGNVKLPIIQQAFLNFCSTESLTVYFNIQRCFPSLSP